MPRYSLLPAAVWTIACLSLSGCGGAVSSFGNDFGTAGGSQTTTVSDGVFRDAIASGVHYCESDTQLVGACVSGGQAGTTGADGVFKFRPKRPVTFSVGAVTLGTATRALASVTPLQFFDKANLNTTAVINIVRFMIMLDSDGNPGNGIQISSGVQAAATNWAPIDFTMPEGNLEAALIGAAIVSDVSSADNWTGVPRFWQQACVGAPSVPCVAFAKSHLQGTLTCLQTGAFRGQVSGPQSGAVGLYIDPKTRLVNGFVRYDSNSGVLEPVNGETPIDFTVNPPTASALTSITRMSIQFTSLDQIDGTTTSTDLGSQTSGTLSGGRMGGSLKASIRITGHHTTRNKTNPAIYDDSGIFFLDVMPAGRGSNQQQVDGQVFDMMSNTTAEVSGYVTFGTELSFSDGQRIFDGTIDFQNATVSGIWTAGNGNTAFGGADIQTGKFEGTGCGL
jgi:hypothetical protein